MLRNDWRDYLLTTDEAEDAKEAYIVFEEDDGKKNYDTCKGIFSNLDVAKEYAESIHREEDIFVSDYKEFTSGSYNYLFEIR